MNTFLIALTTIGIMFLYAVPGFLFIRTKLIPAKSISSFAVMLLYLCSPFQTLDAMQRIEYTPRLLGLLGLTALLSVVVMGILLGGIYLLTREKQRDVRVRICTVATSFGNCGFIGIPLLDALMPNYPEAVSFASAFAIAMNITMWTIGSAIIAHDRRYIRVKKVFLNPTTIGFAVSLIFFFARVHIGGQLGDFIVVLSKMSTALCMLILGMRLGAVPLKPIFTEPRQYAAVGVKLIVMPLIMLGLCRLLPMEESHRVTMYILCCVPVGNVVLSFAEILGEGQDTAANVVLLGTLLSIVTIPFMLLLV